MFLYNTKLEALFQNKVVNSVADGIGDASDLMKILVGNGSSNIMDNAYPKSEFVVQGGAKIEVPVRMANMDARGSATGYDVLNTTHVRTVDNATQEWGRYYAVMDITQDEVDANTSDTAKLSLLEYKLNEAMANIKDMIGTGIYNWTTDAGARGTGSMTGEQGKGINGLGQLAGVYDTTATASYGGQDRVWMGINSDGADWWDCASEDATAHAAADLLDSTSSSYIQTIIRNLVEAASTMGTKPSIIVTTKTLYGYLKQSMLVNQRFADASVGNLGFERLMFEGIPVIWDDKCTAKHIYVLNNRMIGGQPALALATRESGIIQMDPEWIVVNNQLVRQRRVWASVNMFSAYPRLQAAATRVG